ncbi:unnamed protein product [Candidula unifasciata]|uniref:Cytochrome P450 n=1 Tax=Candidula unifasciata TaxID=100452 RepID=A0A8S3ZUB2_9EUPU|nr:unnamed protein product [Candidula unifasciata]
MLTNFIPDLSIPLALLTVITILSTYWLWTKSRRPYTKYNIPPFPVPAKFIFGHMLMIRSNIRRSLSEWREKVGDIFSLDIGGQHNIVVNGYDNIKELLVKHADKLPDIPRTFRNDVIKEENKGILGASGANWKEQRTVSLAILRTFGVGKNVLAERIEEEVEVYINKLASLKGQPADVKLLTNISVSNVICSIIIGKRFDYDDPYFMTFMEHLNNTVRYGSKMSLLKLFPFLYYTPGDPFYAKRWVKSVLATNEMFAKAYIQEIKKSFNEEEEPTTFIAAYLQELKKRQDKGEPTLMDEANLVAIIRNLFAAGTETTSTTTLWCMLYMLHNPEIQEKVYQEIIANVGSERPPNMHDKQKLTYLNAVIQETQRLASLVPIAIPRIVGTTFEFNGYTLPKGSVILPILDSVLHDKKIWGDPENGDLLHPEELIPFSIGRRVCLGEALAKMELFLFLSSVLQRFQLVPADQTNLPSLEAIIGITCMPQPFKIKFVERR